MDLTSTTIPKPIEIDPTQRALIEAIQYGLPLVERPYLAIAQRLGVTEKDVLERLHRLLRQGVIKRWGVVVRHRPLGYQANAMVVWDVPDSIVSELGRRLAEFSFVTLSYRRPRRPPAWTYNLFTMIHGRHRDEVTAHVDELVEQCHLQNIPREILFSTRCFKQRGACYSPPDTVSQAVG